MDDAITRRQLQVAERVLVVGATGGVSVAAMQIASHNGAEVWATTRDPSKARRLSELPCVERELLTDGPGWSDEILDATDGEGVDVVVDAVGAPSWPDSIRSLCQGGRMLVCGASGGDRPDMSIRSCSAQPSDNRGAVRRMERLPRCVPVPRADRHPARHRPHTPAGRGRGGPSRHGGPRTHRQGAVAVSDRRVAQDVPVCGSTRDFPGACQRPRFSDDTELADWPARVLRRLRTPVLCARRSSVAEMGAGGPMWKPWA